MVQTDKDVSMLEYYIDCVTFGLVVPSSCVPYTQMTAAHRGAMRSQKKINRTLFRARQSELDNLMRRIQLQQLLQEWGQMHQHPIQVVQHHCLQLQRQYHDPQFQAMDHTKKMQDANKMGRANPDS